MERTSLLRRSRCSCFQCPPRLGCIFDPREFRLSATPANCKNSGRSWWLITGEGGSGKSRLALELCLRHQGTWKVGFLPDPSGYNRWSEWTPKEPTLIVVDYCSLRAQEIQSIVLSLATREPPLEHRVRVLLIERSIEDKWWKDFQGTGTNRLLVESVGHGDPIAMSEMTDDELWQAIAFLLQKSASKLPDKEETLRALFEVDPLRRPLFAALAADALAAGRDIRLWDQTALLRDVLEREIDRFWKPCGVTERDQNLLCFATLQGGMFVEDLKIPVLADGADLPTTGSTDPARFDAARYQTITGMPSTEFLSPLKPDVLGEFFVLERLKPRDSADDKRGLMAMILAWNARPDGVFDFVCRALTDFPVHPSLELLDLSLRKGGIEIIVNLLETDRENKIMLLAAAKSNLVRAYCERQMMEKARVHYDELLQMSDQWADMQVLESIGVSTVAYLCLAFPSEARSLLDAFGQRWKTQGSHPEHLELLIKASLLTASGWVDKQKVDVATPMCRELIWFAETFCSSAPPYGLLAEQLRSLISAFVEDRQHAAAKQIFDLLSALSGRAGGDPKFAANWGASGLSILTNATEDPREEEGLPDLLEVFESTRIAVQSPHFKEGATVQFDAGFADMAIAVMAEYEKVLGG